jgi:hypothetical protein
LILAVIIQFCRRTDLSSLFPLVSPLKIVTAMVVFSAFANLYIAEIDCHTLSVKHFRVVDDFPLSLRIHCLACSTETSKPPQPSRRLRTEHQIIDLVRFSILARFYS